MGTVFVDSPEQIRMVRAQAEQIELTPDFLSYLGDIAVGMEPEELTARLRANSRGIAMTRYNYAYRIGDEIVYESRRVNETQKKVLQADERLRTTINTRGRQSADYSSYASDIVSGKLSDSQELNARLRANSRNVAMGSDGYTYRKDDETVYELRRVRSEQAVALRELLDRTQTSEKNDRYIADLSSFYRDLNDGNAPATTEELNARLRANDRGYAMDSNGFIYRIDGEYVREYRRVRSNDARLLKADFAATQEVQGKNTNAANFQSFFADILRGRISSREELNARLRANNLGYAMGSDGFTYRLDGENVRETRRVGQESRKLLSTLFAALQACGQYREVVAQALLSGGDGQQVLRDMDKQYMSSMTDADARTMSTQRTAANEICQAWRRGAADVRITQAIIDQKGDIKEVFPLIRDDLEEDIVDRQRKESLTTLCYQRRRVDFSASILATLSDPNVDIDDLLGRINEFRGSPDPKDRERADELTCYIYETEVARDIARLAATIALNPRDPDPAVAVQGNLKFRPTVTGFEYNDILQTRLQSLENLRLVSTEAGVDAATSFVVQNFDAATPASILEAINDISSRLQSTEGAEALLEYYKLYLANRRTLRSGDYEQVFSAEVTALRKALGGDYNFNEGLDTNLPAAKKLASHFSDVILPLFQSLRGEPGFQDIMESFTSGQQPGNREPRSRFTLDVDRLAAQRNLTENEIAYLKSVQALSAFNPYMVAIANANPGLAFAYLESYFTELSGATLDKWFAPGQETPYIPLLQVGTGPNGLASLGEIMRKCPELIGNMAVIDENGFPSGPFGIPKGEAWDLNSANSSGFDAVTLPDLPTEELTGKRIRDYGSPTRWFPGERNADSNTRPGSINTTVDYLPSPDVISDGRYPNNEDLSLILQLQTAMLAENLMLKTKLLGIEEMPEGSKGLYRAWILTTDTAGTKRVVDVLTDGVITSSGLGEKSYGFSLEGSRAETVLMKQPNTGFPKISTTLEAFKALASKEAKAPIPGETIVIYGNGNSTDTLVEYLGGLFESKNPVVRNIRKIYVVGDGQFSRRPRYAQISDLRARNGREGLVEVVEARVGDIDSVDPDSASGKLRLFDTNGNIINDANGAEINGDHVIAATGFRPQLTRIFKNMGVVKETPAGPRLDTKPVVLPTNPNVAVAETIDDRKELLLVGTASNPASFKVADKLLQLPRQSREALLRNGAENAVVIGFRAPDTQAAVRLYLEQNPELAAKRASAGSTLGRHARVLIDPGRLTPVGSSFAFDTGLADSDLPPLRRDVASGSETLGPLLLRNLAPVKLVGVSQNATYSLKLDMNGKTAITTDTVVPTDVLRLVANSTTNPYFQAYARNALRLRRGSNSVEIKLRFNNGRLSFKDSYVQAA